MKAYLSISYAQRKRRAPELAAMKEVLSEFGIETWVFVDQYSFEASQEKEMMKQATRDIDQCDLLIAETSEKGIGVGIEVGYAKGKDKPVIYVREKNAEHSTTVSGISDFQIAYADLADLKKQLFIIISKIVS